MADKKAEIARQSAGGGRQSAGGGRQSGGGGSRFGGSVVAEVEVDLAVEVEEVEVKGVEVERVEVERLLGGILIRRLVNVGSH